MSKPNHLCMVCPYYYNEFPTPHAWKKAPTFLQALNSCGTGGIQYRSLNRRCSCFERTHRSFRANKLESLSPTANAPLGHRFSPLPRGHVGPNPQLNSAKRKHPTRGCFLLRSVSIQIRTQVYFCQRYIWLYIPMEQSLNEITKQNNTIHCFFTSLSIIKQPLYSV